MRLGLLKEWSQSAWAWLTATDLDGRPIVWTQDEADPVCPLKPFPHHLPYLEMYIEDILSDPYHQFVLVDKSRQMVMTWATILYIDWECMFLPLRRWLLSKSTEDEAAEILKDKPRFMHTQLPLWVQEVLPCSDKPAVMCVYPTTNSRLMAVAQNVAEREARGGTASGFMVDEAARLAYFEQVWGAGAPMAARIFAITTAQTGNPGARYFKKLIDEGIEL